MASPADYDLPDMCHHGIPEDRFCLECKTDESELMREGEDDHRPLREER